MLQRSCANPKIRPLVIINGAQPIILESLYNAGMQLSMDRNDYQLPVLRIWNTIKNGEFFGLG